MNDKEKKAIEQFSNLDFDIDNFDCKKCVFQEREDCIGCIDYIRKTILNLIENQKAEIEKKDIALRECERNLIEERQNRIKEGKIIDLMAKELVKAHEWFYSEFDNYTKEDFIKYFENKAEEDK